MGRVLGLVTFVVLCAACGDAEVPEQPAGGSGGSGGEGGGEPCAPYEAEVDGACLPAGVDADSCAQGFASDGRGGCVPILPAERCPPGEMAIPGETACREVAPCGSGTWGDIPVEAGTIYVDGSNTAPGAGTAVDPFATVSAALAAADAGDMVAIAAGTYEETLTLNERVRIWGRCPRMVSIDGLTAGMYVHADGVEVHTLAVSPSGFGVFIEAEDVELDRIWVHDAPDAGIALFAPASATVRDSLIEKVSGLGIATLGAPLTIERSVVRDMVSNIDAPGRGLSVELHVSSGQAASLTLSSSVVDGALESGIAIIGSEAIIEGSVILDSQPQADGRFGNGIAVQGLMVPGQATIRDTYVGDSHGFGLTALNATVAIDRVTIENVAPQQSDGGYGDGIVVLGSWHDASVEVSHTRIAGATRAGIANFDARVVLESVALECNTIHLDGEAINGSFDFDNRGGNACWCGDVGAECKVLSSSLEPPTM